MEVGSKPLIGSSIYGVVVIDGSLYSRFYGILGFAKTVESNNGTSFCCGVFCRVSVSLATPEEQYCSEKTKREKISIFNAYKTKKAKVCVEKKLFLQIFLN